MTADPVPSNTILTLHELHDVMSPSSVRRRLQSGRWQSPLPQVVLTRPGPLTRPQKRAAALTWAGPFAALSGRTAAAVNGLRGYDDDLIHVMVDIESGLRSRDFVVVHRTAWWDPTHIHPSRQPRRARIERAVIDIAVDARSWQNAIAVPAAAVQQRLTQVDHLRRVLMDFPTACWRRELLAMFVDLEGGSQSLPELQAVRALRRAGLPEPDRQAVRREGSRRRYLDLWWDLYQLCIEIDGALHMSAEQWWADMLRDAEISATGASVVRVPAFVVREIPDAFTELVRRLLVVRGMPDPGSLVLK